MSHLRTASQSVLWLHLRLAAAAMLVVACGSFRWAAAASNPYLVDSTETVIIPNETAGSPLLCSDSMGHVYMAIADHSDAANHRMMVYRSEDTGITWDSGTTIDDPLSGPVEFGQFGAGDIECDDFGNVYVTWGNGGNQDIYVGVSHDSGQTWQTPKRVNRNPLGSDANLYPELAQDGHGNVYVAWIDWGGLRSIGVYENTSHDFGDSWDISDKRISGSVDCIELKAVCADASGNVYIAFLPFTTSDGLELYIKVSTDFGETFGPAIHINDMGTDPGFFGIAADEAGHLVIAWQETGSNVGDILCRTSSNHGTTFSANPVRVNAYGPSLAYVGFRDVRVTCDGVVYVLWVDSRLSSDELFCNRSFDYGLSWGEEDQQISFTGTPQDEWLAATRNGHVYVAWTRSGAAVANVSCDEGLTWSGELALSSPSDVGQIVVAADDRGNAFAVWDVNAPCDIRGRRLFPSVGVGISGPEDPVRVPPGGLTFDYTVSVSNNTMGPIADAMFFLDATKPDGTTTPPFIGPVTRTLPAGLARSKTVRLHIPGRVPSGEYLVSLRVAGPVTDQNHMCIIKE